MGQAPWSVVISLGIGLLCQSCDTRKPAETSELKTSENEAELIVSDSMVLPEKVTFNAHIQPILSEKCYHCHGPDSGTRKPNKTPLRIDREQFAFEPRENGKPVIIKGVPADSLLVELMKTSDVDEIMPPSDSHKTISKQEIALIEKWIEQGAEYQEHWAFLPPLRGDLPDVKNKTWTSNPIDTFTLAHMEKEGLKPNVAQSPQRLLRRIHFDVIGLPPSPERVKSFVAAYKKNPIAAVNAELDILFELPAYGEQQGRLWLDAARYADTHGIHIDNYREIWPYRDWVVQAFNDNMPFDQFTVEQLAGDMLPDASLDQMVATGFNRCLPTTGEGGSIVDEVNAMYATDRVNTTFGVWQGLTVGCAECHDHKFDPVTQKEFYQISAFFRNTTMSALDRNNGRHPPNVFAPRPEDRPRLAKIEQELTQWKQVIKSKQKKRNQQRKGDFETWFAKQKNAVNSHQGEINIKGLELHLPLLGSSGDALSGWLKGEKATWKTTIKTRSGVFGPALLVGDQASVGLGDAGDFNAKRGFSYGGFVYIEGQPNGAILARMDPADNQRGWDLWLQNGQIGAHVIEQWPSKAVKAYTKAALKPKQWHHVFVVFDPSKRKASLTVYLDGKPAAIDYTHNKIVKNIHTKVPLRLGSRAANDGNLSGVVALQDLRVIDHAMSAKDVQALVVDSLVSSAQLAGADNALKQLLRKQFDVISPPEKYAEQVAIDALAKESENLKKRGSYTLIMTEKSDSEPFAHILERGDYAAKGEKVLAGTPAVLASMTDEMPANRYGLALWLVDTQNPLTARVTINRYWHYLFGRGIVETTEDFGIMGGRPSHPALLDWLACEFVESGWNIQHMLRMMITSSTYRQSAIFTDEKKKKDPLNISLARSPRFRLHGEQLRDMALAVSGLLVTDVGGAPVKPYQPVGIWETVSMKKSNTRYYKADKGGKLYRRSLYTIWKRTAPHPAMELLNAPPRDVFCVRRELTNTPLAAFVTMNDEQFVEASRVLASHAMKASTEPTGRLDYLTTRLIARRLTTEEHAIVSNSLKESLVKFEAAPVEATELISIGATPVDTSLPSAELAAWTLVASQIFNLDETLTR